MKDEAFHEILFSAEAEEGSAGAMLGRSSEEIRLGWQDSYYEKGSPVGKHTIQIGRSQQKEIVASDTETFEKWSQAIASAYDLIGDASSAYEESREGYMFGLVIPVLVVRAKTLWVADYDAKGNLAAPPRQIDSVEVYIAKNHSDVAVSYTISHLHVVTVAGLEAFLDAFAESGAGWPAWFPRKAVEGRRD